MDFSDSADTLGRLNTLRQETRAHLSGFWFPLLVGGAGMAIAGAAALLISASMLGDFQLSVSVLTTPLISVWFSRRHRRLGLRQRHWRYKGLAIGLTVGSMLATSLFPTHPVDAAAWLPAAAALLVFARWEKSIPVGAVGALMALTAIIAMSRFPAWPAGTLTMIEGGIMVIGGCALLFASKREGSVAR